MKKIVCACSYENPEGTHLCAQCGRPLTKEDEEKKVVDMRYDGTAIRSKTYKTSFIDRIWNFFSSVKVGVSLIVITLVLAAIGTFLPQIMFVSVPPGMETIDVYEEKYGFFGKAYYVLGFSNIYASWWFQTIVGMLAVSIIIASLDRGIPLYKALKHQRVRRHASFMKRQRLVSETVEDEKQAAETFELAAQTLKSMRYHVKREQGALLAEKGRFSRFGPYINHVGLIIFISGVMLRLMPGFYVDESLWVREGETTAIPGVEGYYIKNNQFILETYDEKDLKGQDSERVEQAINTRAKNYQTDVTLYKEDGTPLAGDTADLQKIGQYSIQVNKPLKYDGFALYQTDFKQDELKTMTFDLVNKTSKKSLGQITIDLRNPKKEYVINKQTKVALQKYYPDFTEFKDGEPQTASSIPNNPAFIFKMITPEQPKGETSFVAIRQTLEPFGETTYKMKFQSVETRDASNLTVRKDKTLPILLVGGIIFMIGVTMGSYWSHRRIWLQRTEDGRVLLAAHTNKNWFSMKKDVSEVCTSAHLTDYHDQLEEREKQ